jgi:hypothetical protein
MGAAKGAAVHCLDGRGSYDAATPSFARQTTLNADAPSRRPAIASGLVLRALCLWACALLAACGSFEDKRIHELLVEKGFGTRATGDATRENYIGGRDFVQFLFDAEALIGNERLAELSVPQPVQIDGTIFIPYVGPVHVLGKTEAEAAALVKAQLAAVGSLADLEIQARIAWPSAKVFYAIGEVGLKGPAPMEADLTLIDAMFLVRWTPLANLGRVHLIRPDAQHPLKVDINFREMLDTGLTTANVPIRERDILYVPPTFLGLIARLLERLLMPVGLAVSTVLGIAQTEAAYDALQGNGNPYVFRY